MVEQGPDGTITEAAYQAQRRRATTMLVCGILLIASAAALFLGLYVLFPSEEGPQASFSLLLGMVGLFGVGAIVLYRKALAVLAGYKVAGRPSAP